MIYLKLFVTKILILRLVVGEIIEYYPSRSAFANAKANTIQNQLFIENNLTNDVFHKQKSKVVWRHFNINERATTKQSFKKIHIRAVDPVFRGHPKTREEMWNENFLNDTTAFDQTPSLIKLIHNITLTYLHDCTPVILYDSQIKEKESYFFQNLLKEFPVTFVHGYINDNNTLAEPKLLRPVGECLHFVVFLTEVRRSAKVLGKQSDNKVVIVARSSQWAVQDFLAGPLSRTFINLLVIGQSFKENEDSNLELPLIMYTHKLYTDGLGASQPIVLNSWSHGKFSREVNLFPPKMSAGYAGHRFVVAAANQPPFVFRRVKTDADGGNPRVAWDGIEIRLLNMLAEINNFSLEIHEPRELQLGPGDAVVQEILMGRADIGVAGMYMTKERLRDMDSSFAHSQDCAAFVTLMSTALPRYRAILGPFHWHVWLALTLTYLFGILPLAFSDKHTLRHLIENTGEIENMFWYVFGTFTNCFTFVGKNSWSKTTKITTRLLIGWYWIFTIIITSCYTGSIIAFVTLPVFPETVDSIEQLLAGFYRVSTLDRGGWDKWFLNSSDLKTNKLLKKLEIVPSVEAGIMNTTKAFFWPHAFLGSRAELEYIVQANFTATKKRAQLHISNECFVPFGVMLGFPNNSLYTKKLSGDVMRMLQSGLLDKLTEEVRWDLQRSSAGKLLAVWPGHLNIVSAQEKGLTLEDTQGMFLLLAAGFLLAATALLSEWMGGFTRKCRLPKKAPSSANSREQLITTPQSKGHDIKGIVDGTDSRLLFSTRPSSADSRDTLEGQVINVTEENIIVHSNLAADRWNSRRSSSVDLDREVREIFENDLKVRGVVVEDISEMNEDGKEGREETTSHGAFGDRVKQIGYI